MPLKTKKIKVEGKDLRYDVAKDICTQLMNQGHKAYLAGGCVRDLLMGKEPKDYDVATSATHEEVAGIFAYTKEIGAAFGVCQVSKDGLKVEVATFRKDGPYKDGRRPEAVEICKDPEEDVKRRDFTVNALLLDPTTNTVLDYVGGMEDIENKVLRTVGDPNERFQEDHLRMLRAVRFCTTHDLFMDPATRDAIVANSKKMSSISMERKRDELLKIGVSGKVGRGVYLLVECDLYHLLAPTSARDSKIDMSIIRACRELPKDCDPIVALYVMFYQQWGYRELGSHFKLSNDDEDKVSSFATKKDLYGKFTILSEVSKKKFLGDDYIPDMDLCYEALRKAGLMEIKPGTKEAIAKLLKTDYKPAPYITGKELIAMGYLFPSPNFAAVIEKAYDEQLEGKFDNKDEAKMWVEDTFLGLARKLEDGTIINQKSAGVLIVKPCKCGQILRVLADRLPTGNFVHARRQVEGANCYVLGQGNKWIECNSCWSRNSLSKFEEFME